MKTAKSILFLLVIPALAQRAEDVAQPLEVQPDGTVTFRLKAPQATEVRISGDFLTASQAMQKNEQGVWTFQAGPLQPAVYSYSYTVDGVRAIDPDNPYTQPGVRSSSSLFEVPAEKPSFYDAQPVPHGTVRVQWYESKAIGAVRSVHVYTPPDYDHNKKARYPALYLLHGSGDTDGGWVDIGRANFILDNLIASGSVKPMVVVMPFGHPYPAVGFGGRPAHPDASLFERELLDEILPMVERTYRVSRHPDDRAIAGLSMGGGQALAIGFTHLDRFRWIGVFSAGLFGREDWDARLKDAVADPAATNKKLRAFWIGCGKSDRTLEAAEKLDQFLTQHEIRHTFTATEGAHTWRVWRNYLRDFSQLLFK